MRTGNSETIRIVAPQAGTCYIKLVGTVSYDMRANLRRRFKVDRFHIAHAARVADGKMTAKDVAR